MPTDYTQQQSADDEQRSRQLSLKHTRPPTEIPGYKIERFLGAGAYGEVWVGTDRNTGRQVAIKFFAHRRGVDWSLLSREVEKLVFLSADRYVVQLLEVGWDAEPPYYVMEFVESGSLDDLLREVGPLHVAEAVEVFREICVGLSHAHGKGVLHCDLKPANILLDQDHRPRLADFGQSRLSSEQTPALGTLFYMAPEQTDLTAVPDVRWDVYALGAIFHCMLVGEPPHRSHEVAQQLETAADLPDRLARYRQAISDAPPPTTHRQVRGMDRSLSEIIERCLAVDPEQRYTNVQEIITSLQQRQLARQRQPVIAFGFLFPLLVLLVMGFFGWRGYQQALRDTEELATGHAVKNNEFAARLAAQQVADDIQQYFEIAEDESTRPPFLQAFEDIRNDELLMKLRNTETSQDQMNQWRNLFYEDPRREKLDEFLQRRLKRHNNESDLKLASIFALDAEGWQLAAAFAGNEKSQSVGRNVAFRAYFHGRSEDLPRDTRVSDNVRPVERTHLSAVYQSTTTGTWKVAIATPVKRSDEEIIGLFVITINLGDFKFFSQVQQENRFAALVDGRPGKHTGSILQHPLFSKIAAEGRALPESFRERRVPLNAEGRLQETRYHDPLSDDPEGADYRGTWIATAVPVTLIGEEKDSGLVVLVQESYDAVSGPVRQLGARLLSEGAWAFLVVILVTVLLWFGVLRLIREPRVQPRPRMFPPESTPHFGETTLPVGR